MKKFKVPQYVPSLSTEAQMLLKEKEQFDQAFENAKRASTVIDKIATEVTLENCCALDGDDTARYINDVRELFGLKLRHEPSEEQLKNLTLERITDIKGLDVEVNTDHVSDDYKCAKRKAVVISFSEEPRIRASMEIAAVYLPQKNFPKIHRLSISVEKGGKVERNPEIEPFVEYCEEQLDIQLFIRCMKEYVKLSISRSNDLEDLLSQSNHGDELTMIEPNVIYVHNGTDKVELAKVTWKIRFDGRALCFEDRCRVEFTEVGHAAATECQMPSELLEDGWYSHWSPKECLENLGKMASTTSGSMIEAPITSKNIKSHSTRGRGRGKKRK